MARVMVVEDESVLRLTFGEFLTEEGYDVETADDYNDAVRLLDRVFPWTCLHLVNPIAQIGAEFGLKCLPAGNTGWGLEIIVAF